MAYQERWAQSVVFITVPVPTDSVTLYEPVGTGFIVRAQSGRANLFYVFTAAHVVQNRPSTYIRMRNDDDQIVDIQAGDWFVHDDSRADLAVCVVGGFAHRRYHQRSLSFHLKAGRRPGFSPVQVGDEAHYIGLLAPVASMQDRMVPFVRSGTIGAMNQTNLPVDPLDSVDEFPRVDGHLLDCRGRGGFSGSPCFVHRKEIDGLRAVRKPTSKMPVIGRPPETTLKLEQRERENFLGVFVGYFPEERAPDRTSGVGIVVPQVRILELLWQEDVEADREARLKAAESERGGP